MKSWLVCRLVWAPYHGGQMEDTINSDSVATRIGINLSGMQKQHIGIVFPVENTYSMHKKPA